VEQAGSEEIDQGWKRRSSSVVRCGGKGIGNGSFKEVKIQ